MNEFWNKIKGFASKAVQTAATVFKVVADGCHEHHERQQKIKQYNDEHRNWDLFHSFQLRLQADYDAFADAVYKCIQSNYETMGLSHPHAVEDVCCETDWQKGFSVPHIDGNQNNIIFRYEATRRISDMFLGGMKKIECPRVQTTHILPNLRRELSIYAKRRGYGFVDLDVIDIPGDKIRITVIGVYRVPTFIQPQISYNFGGVCSD